MNNERNNMPNNDEIKNSSLSSFPSINNDRGLESQGDNLAAGQARSVTPPPISNISRGTNSTQGGLPKKDGIDSENNNSRDNSNQNKFPQKNHAMENPGARNNAINRNALGNLAGGKKALQNFAASSALQAAGVPKIASDAIVNSKLGQKALAAAQDPAGAALKSVKNLGKTEAEKDAAEQEETEKEKEKTTGAFMLRVPLHVKLIIFLGIVPIFCFILLFIVIIGAFIGDEKTGAIFYGELSASEKSELNELRKDVGRGDGNLTYEEFLSRYENLGNIFEYFECEDEEACLQRDEVKFYIKINDIALRYRKIHNVKLEWTLLLATALSFDLDIKEMFDAFYNYYNYDDVEKYDILMNLDWNYDYKKIPGYKYLDRNDYRYDLQILAKNMVRKTTTQTCTKCTSNSDGTVTCVITKSRTDEDVEDQYLKPGQEYYLKCDSGETYDISSSYRYDEEKYKEFLLEYIEHKFYLEGGSTGITDDGDTDMTPSPSSGEYIFPLPSNATSCRSSAYGYRYHPITGKYGWHSGDDYPAASGTSVYAVADGKVSAAANSGWNGGMGNYVIIDHGNGLQSIYMHAVKVYVSVGDEVKQGQVIMGVGTTGSSTGNHLHITFKQNGELREPANYIGALRMCG